MTFVMIAEQYFESWWNVGTMLLQRSNLCSANIAVMFYRNVPTTFLHRNYNVPTNVHPTYKRGYIECCANVILRLSLTLK